MEDTKLRLSNPLRRVCVAAALAVGFLFASAHLAAEEAPSVVDEIVRMLEAEIGEPIVLDWLGAGERWPTSLTADDMIALKRAGATDELLSRLVSDAPEVERTAPGPPAAEPGSDASPTAVAESSPEPSSEPSESGPEAGAPTATEAAPSASPSSDEGAEAATPLGRALAPPPVEAAEVPVDEALDSASAATAAVEEAAVGDEAGEGVLTHFRLAYSPLAGDDDEPLDLFVYLDGEPLSYVPESTISGPFGGVGEGLRFSLRLPAGEHKLVVFLERHERRRRSWTHTAKVAPETLEFELLEGAPAEVEVVFAQSTLQSLDPLTLVVRQEERVVEKEEVGGEPDLWPSLCEDLEAEADSDRGHDPTLARRLRGCVSWEDLWTGDGPTRTQVLEALERFDFRPIPKGA